MLLDFPKKSSCGGYRSRSSKLCAKVLRVVTSSSDGSSSGSNSFKFATAVGVIGDIAIEGPLGGSIGVDVDGRGLLVVDDRSGKGLDDVDMRFKSSARSISELQKEPIIDFRVLHLSAATQVRKIGDA